MKKTIFFLPALLLLLCFQCEDDDIALADLPEFVQSYLQQNHPGAEIEEVETDTLCTGQAVLEVVIEVSEDVELELVFSAEENLLFTASEIRTSELPTAVTSAIASQFSGATTKEAERLDGADGSVQYEVELKNGSVVLDALFSADGEFICSKIDNEEDDEG
ncbi:MAG: PepSY-like domain-containing protein [Saprospiraceae bacterium]|nr:PepSY-like domain-containing protein [Saprospiraceae bacterium]MDZ4704705.1 PepSY-like domain-containing protein [Saprospiraceae bacterium]